MTSVTECGNWSMPGRIAVYVFILHFSGTVFQIEGSTGIAKLYKPAPADGQHPATYLADVFTFQDGAWRAVYSQHTFVEGECIRRV